VLTLAKALDVKPEDAAALFDAFNRGHAARAPQADDLGEFGAASWELAMARKDAR